MPRLETDLFGWVQTQPELAALLGGLSRPRWYYGVAPQNPTPVYVVWQLGGAPSEHHQLGKAALEHPLLSIDVIGAADAAAVRAVVWAIDTRLDGFSGQLVPGGANVRRITRQLMLDLPESRDDGSDRARLRTRLEYSCWVI